jgi:2,4-dienoyl-CoA reductase-like NADH-dependent reductase (Old Yellow Enzyme family)
MMVLHGRVDFRCMYGAPWRIDRHRATASENPLSRRAKRVRMGGGCARWAPAPLERRRHIEGDENAYLYRYLARELNAMKLAYLHVFAERKIEALLQEIRDAWSKPLMLLRAERTIGNLAADIASGLADMIAIGRWALANPDFISRFERNEPLNEADHTTFYGGTAKGYTDYPTLAQLQSAGK